MFKPIVEERRIFMANQYNSLSHTKWLCKYHIVIVPKYRRKVIYNQYRKDLQEIIRTLCKYKGVEIIEESCIVKTDCSKSENMVKYFQESERDEKENELHKGV